MVENCINIRRARLDEVDEIFWLLHSESIGWNTERIILEIEKIVLILSEEKIIGAAYCVSCEKGLGFEWVAIHPMYPKQAVSKILKDSYSNILNKHKNDPTLTFKDGVYI